MAVTPIDGRYRARTAACEDYFSEFALIRYRVRVEIEWYLSLAGDPAITRARAASGRDCRRSSARFTQTSRSPTRAASKQLEATTNHDVKAVEYFVKEQVAALDSKLPIEMVHFACTSEDINNLAYALILKEFVRATS